MACALLDPLIASSSPASLRVQAPAAIELATRCCEDCEVLRGQATRYRWRTPKLAYVPTPSSCCARRPPRAPPPTGLRARRAAEPPSRSTSSSSTEAFLPAGAASSTTTSRASPCTCTRRRAPSRGAGRSRATCSSRRICRRRTRSRRSRFPAEAEMVAEAAAAEADQMDVDDRLEAICGGSRQPPLAGVFQHEEDDGFGSYRASAALPAPPRRRASARTPTSRAPATWTKWERPVELTCVVLGVTVAWRTTRRRASAARLVAECADVASRLWSSSAIGAAAARAVDPRPAVLNDLRVDDPRVCRLDLCLSSRRRCFKNCATTSATSSYRRTAGSSTTSGRPAVTAGSVTATAIDLYAGGADAG